MRNLTTIPILFLIVGSSGALAQPADTTNYFPIEIGNSWTYYHVQERYNAPPDTGIGLPREITEAFSVNDTVYYHAPHPESLADTLRDDGEGRIWARVLGKDVLLYDFTIEDSEKYLFDHTSWPDDAFEVMIERHVTVDVVAGHFENCVRLTFDIPEAVDDERSFTFAPGVGLVVSSHWGEGTYLYEAVIGGKVISGLEEDGPMGLPSRRPFAYPNPFQTSTTLVLPYDAASQTEPRLEVHRLPEASATVYDVLGRRVSTLRSTNCSIDGCMFEWDGGDAPNGLYFVVLDRGRDVVSVVLAR